MTNQSVPMRIGDHYFWGGPTHNKRTVVSGFFADRENRRKEVALTVAPPFDFRQESYGCLEVISGLICIATPSNHGIDMSVSNLSVFTEILKETAPVKSKCILVGLRDRSDAIIVSTNRTVIINGMLCRGMYELSTKGPIRGPSGAAVVLDGKLVALFVGMHCELHDEWRSFAIGVSPLHNRLKVLEPSHESDIENNRSFRTSLAEFEKNQRRQYEGVA
jgi:hypothetical protein